MTHPHARTRRSLLAAALATLLPPARAAGDVDFGWAIDTAGRQRMLSQRVVKAYCQIGLQVAPQVSRLQLEDALGRFDSQLATLEHAVPGTATRNALRRLAALWSPFRALAAGPVSRDGARRLAELDGELLLAAHAVVLTLEQSAGTPRARLVNLAGRQRMLAQRLAKLYMLRVWDVAVADVEEQIERAATEFTEALATLRAAPGNSSAIVRELDAVALQWAWFEGAIALQGAQSYTLVVADASESMLGSMDLVTAMYAELARR